MSDEEEENVLTISDDVVDGEEEYKSNMKSYTPKLIVTDCFTENDANGFKSPELFSDLDTKFYKLKKSKYSNFILCV